MPEARGTLFVVATPIGNLGDVTFRALETLRAVPLIAAEDTRIAKRLLARYEIGTRLLSYHAQSGPGRLEALLTHLRGGQDLAVVTDAGTPAVSDPGARVVAAVVRAGHRVVPIPGASAVAAAVSTAGLEAPRFAFMGFLPPAQKARAELLALHAELPSALVLYEAPHRLGATLAELAATLDPRRTVVIAREITKTFETITRMPLADAVSWAAADANAARGEFVVIVDAPLAGGGTSGVTLDARRLLDALADELPPARAARVAAKVTQLPREVLYEMALARKR